MNEFAAYSNHRAKVFYRLIAVWVLAESGLGGLLHGLKLPVTGLLVGGSAMLCIMLIAWHFPKPGSVLKAMVLVMLMKFSLSPHSPFPAYLAVLFQGIAGEFILRGRKFFLMKCLFFGSLGMMESAMQRLLVMVFISGTEIWEALDVWIHKVSSGLGPQRLSHWLAISYLLVHLISGIFIGMLGWKLISLEQKDFPVLNPEVQPIEVTEKKGRGSKGILVPVICLLAFILFLLPGAGIPSFPGKWPLPLNLVLRMIWVYGLVVYLLVPVLDYFFRKILAGNSLQYGAQLSEIREILPEMLALLKAARKHARQQRLGFITFLALVVFNICEIDEESHHP